MKIADTRFAGMHAAVAPTVRAADFPVLLKAQNAIVLACTV